MRQVDHLAEQTGESKVARPFSPGQLDKGDVIGLVLGMAFEHGRPGVKHGYLKTLLFPMVLFLACSFGCATKKGYFYHPNKTTADKQADYSQCMYYLDASFSRYGTVSSSGAETWGSDSQAQIARAVERCMKAKGYRIISEKEAKQLGVNTQDPWPPHSKTSSSTGP
ncbi:MAG: hypothetical protein SWQ30_11370 [Thermodesulfobacteriota bacterium]|nr:hypothetical protein [Thermodesulfobacteriota bacterium]